MYDTVRTTVCTPVDRLTRLIIVSSPFRDATSTESLSSQRIGHSLPGMVVHDLRRSAARAHDHELVIEDDHDALAIGRDGEPREQALRRDGVRSAVKALHVDARVMALLHRREGDASVGQPGRVLVSNELTGQRPRGTNADRQHVELLSLT